MRRLLLPLSIATVSFAFVACDPDLTVAPNAGADAAAEVSVDPGPGPVAPGEDGGDASEAGTDDDGGTSTDEDAGPGLAHDIDGQNDFKPNEKFVTSSTKNGYEGFITWDAKNLYIGMAGDDLGSGASATKWVLVYLDGGASSTETGQKYGSQEPALPFAASYHIGLKTDLSYTNRQKWDGTGWVDAGITLIPVAKKSNGFLEVAIPRSALGSPTKVKVHVSMINEAAGSEWTYSSLPSTSITDGKDPDYTRYFEFDLADTTKAPNTYQPK